MKATRMVQHLVIGVAGAALLAACGGTSGTASATTKGASSGSSPAALTLGLAQGQDFVHAMPARVAQAQGFFQEQGLKVRIVSFTAGSDLTKAISGGTVDVGATTGLDVVSGAAHQVDVKAFYGSLAKTPMSLIAGTRSGITGFDTLKGHKIGISKFGSLTDYTAKVIAQKQGLAASELKEVPLGAPSENISALSRGDVDAVLLPVNFAFAIEAKGGGKAVAAVSDISSDDQFAVLAASQKFLDGSADTARRLTKAYSESITYMKANRSRTVALAVSALGMTTDIAGQTYDALIGGFTADGTMNTAGLAGYASALPALKVASSSPSTSAYYVSTFVPVTR